MWRWCQFDKSEAVEENLEGKPEWVGVRAKTEEKRCGQQNTSSITNHPPPNLGKFKLNFISKWKKIIIFGLNYKMRFVTFLTKFQEEDEANGKMNFFPEYEFQSMSTWK